MKKKISFKKIKSLPFPLAGLSSEEVDSQRKKFGDNEIVEVVGNPLKEIALETLKDPMIWFLCVIGFIFFWMGEKTDGIVLLSAILPLVLMDAFLHWRTEASTNALKGNLATETMVLRNNQRSLINSRDLVPGDLVLLKNNDILPSDGAFLETDSLLIDESALTGEAFPVYKKFFDVEKLGHHDKDDVWVEEESLGFAGTRVLSGKGEFLVLETGRHTDYAQIVQAVGAIPREKTPLQTEMSRLVNWLLWGAGGFCLFLAAIRMYQGKGLMDAFLSAATLAVAAIPEEFPVVFPFYLGIGVYRLAKKHVLVRRAVSVENIGRINRICTDKTGTITAGELKLTHVMGARGVEESAVLKCALNASNSQDYDPVDQAIVEVATSRHIVEDNKIQIFPFTEDKKRESAIVETSDGRFAFVKGSPDSIFSMVQFLPSELEEWRDHTKNFAQGGHKVLACAWKKISGSEGSDPSGPSSDFIFSGLLAFEDPPRAEVIEAMRYCHSHNIKVTMITGDHPETARAIARQVELSDEFLNVISAEDHPEKFEEKWLEENPLFLQNIHVVARCKPLQKLSIVMALKKSGELVAVTGDGVNDVPALKMADISIAMGKRGTRSAKEVSFMVLTDDNFSTIVNAVAEGRQLFVNLKKSFEYLILFHIPFVLTAAIIPLMGYPLLYLPIQIVWLELIIHPTALFAFQGQAKKSLVNHADAQFFSRKEGQILFFLGFIFSGIIVYNYISGLTEINHPGHARGRVMAMLSLWSAFLVIILADLSSRVTQVIIVLTLGLSFCLIQIPKISALLHLSPIHLSDWVFLTGAVGVYSLFVKLVKTNLHKARKRN